MNINKRNFFSLLDRMEKKGTLNESLEKQLILVEAGKVSKILKHIGSIDTVKYVAKLQKILNRPVVSFADGTIKYANDVNVGMLKLSDQIESLARGESIGSMMKGSVIMKSFDNFVDSFVDVELLRLNVLDRLSDKEITNVKQWIKGKVPYLSEGIAKRIDLDIASSVLGDIQKTYKLNNEFAILSSVVGEAMGKSKISDILLGLMKRDGKYFNDLNGSIDKLLEVNEIINSKWAPGTKNTDGVLIGGEDIWPQLKSKWNDAIDRMGGKDKVLSTEVINKIIKNEIKNNTGVNLFNVKYKNKLNSFFSKKRIKDIPKKVKLATNGVIDDVDLADAIIVASKTGMDVYVVKDVKYRGKLLSFFNSQGVKYQNFMDWVKKPEISGGGGKNYNKKIHRSLVIIPTVVAMTPILGALSYYLYCMSGSNSGKVFTDEEIAYFATKGIDNPGGVMRKILTCSENMMSPIANWGLLWIEDIVNDEIKPEFLALDLKIQKELEKRCTAYKSDTPAPCCNINCDEIENGEFKVVGADGESEDIIKALKKTLDNEKIKGYITKAGGDYEEVLILLDSEGKLDGIFSEDGESIEPGKIIGNVCRKMMNDQMKCISDYLTLKWGELVNFEIIEDGNCNTDYIKKHVNDKIDELKVYENLIVFSDTEVAGKFNISEGDLINPLKPGMYGSKISNLTELGEGYNSIIDLLFADLCKRSDPDEIPVDLSEIQTYEYLIDMVMDLYGKKLWGVDCDDYSESEETVERNMFWYFQEYEKTQLYGSGRSFWDQVHEAFDWWYPKYKDLCGEGDVTPVNPVTPDGPDDEDIDGPDDEVIDGEDDEDIF